MQTTLNVANFHILKILYVKSIKCYIMELQTDYIGVISLNKLLTIFTSLLLLFITSCSSPSNTSDIDNKLYNDAEKLVQTFYEEAENSKVIAMSDSLDDQINKFNAKYDQTDDKWSSEEKEFIFKVGMVSVLYTDYSLYKEPEKIEEFYNNIDNLKTKYDIEI